MFKKAALFLLLLLGTKGMFAIDPLNQNNAFTLWKQQLPDQNNVRLCDFSDDKKPSWQAAISITEAFDKMSHASIWTSELDITASMKKFEWAELFVSMPYQYYKMDRTAGNDSLSGIADSEVDIKFSLPIQNNMGLAIKTGAVLPTGNEKKGLGDGSTSYMLGGVASGTNGAMQVSGEYLYYITNSIYNNYAKYDISMEYNRSNNVFYIYVQGSTSEIKGNNDTTYVANIGASHSFQNNVSQLKYWQLGILGGRRIASTGPNYRAYITVAYNF